MRDRKGREIDYLRISITDRCNLRCIYCMPKQGVPSCGHKEILTYEELERLCRIFAELGIKKIKITGGEPLVRKNCDVFVRKLYEIPGIESITMTTNGVLLSNNIDQLVKAGLSAVNISLDAINEDTFSTITTEDHWKETMEGVQKALEYPSLKVKINCVPLKGINDAELVKIAELAKENPIHVRFIEMMPIGLGRNFSFLSEDKVREILEGEFGSLSPISEQLGNGPAHYFKVQGFQGRIGFISARTHKFCESCNRIRLTADGFLKTCLQFSAGIDLKQAIRNSSSDEDIKELIMKALLEKPDCHVFDDLPVQNMVENRRMNDIGG